MDAADKDDLFGADDPEEEEDAQVVKPGSAQPFDDIFGDSDDDEAPVKGAKASGGDSDDELNDSDDDGASKKKVLGKQARSGKDSKEGGRDKNRDKMAKRAKKKKEGRLSKGGATVTSSGRAVKRTSDASKRDRPEDAGGKGKGQDEGDEYDSGDDVTATRDDRRFLADEDNRELAGVMAEYDDEEQNFDGDERPRKKKRGGDGNGGSGRKKELDPFSETLLTMKRPKVADMSEPEKTKVRP